jgi:3-oxoacyl-[acyl-carrier-protein] synthase II
MKKRVVITGMEALSPIGKTAKEFWNAATEGKCGIQTIQSFDADSFSTRIGGEIKGFEASSIDRLEKPERLTRVTQYALYCAQGALHHAQLSPEEIYRAGVFIGTGWGGTPEIETAFKAYYAQGWKKVPPLTVLKGMPNSIANHLALHFKMTGPNVTICNACVSSAEAIVYAAQQIRQGHLPLAVCGGAESLLWESVMAGWCRMRVMSTRNDSPQTSCRPFDKDRDGMVISDGAGIIVLEDYDHARARGAKIYAEITGFGSSCDASHITAPSVEGQTKAIQAALDDARLSPTDIQAVNAHGTATLLNDTTETQSIKQVFQNHAYALPITAQKSMTGHTIGAAGVLEIIATAMSLNHSIVLPTINLNHPDPECDLDYVSDGARAFQYDIALSNHFAFGGANTVIVLQKGE